MRAVLRWATPVLALGNAGLVVSGVLDLRDALVVVLAGELLLALAAAGTALAALRSYRRSRAEGTTAWKALDTTVRAVLPPPLATVVLHELALVRSLWLVLRRRADGVGPHDLAFGHAAGVGLTMGALTAVTAVEVVVVHLVVPWPWVRTTLLAVGLWTLVVVLGLWAGLRSRPHVVTGDGLLLRAGQGVAVEVPWSSLARLQRRSSHEPTSVRVVGRRLHLPVHGTTTLLAELHEPVTAHLRLGRTAQVDSIAFTADDPTALLSAVSARTRDLAAVLPRNAGRAPA